MMNLQESKERALRAYREARAAWMATITKENIKGDFEKWKVFCTAKSTCMKYGVRI